MPDTELIRRASTKLLALELVRRKELPGGWQEVDQCLFVLGYALVPIAEEH